MLKTSNAEFVRLQATVIQQDLKRIGVDLEVQWSEFATFLSDVIKGNFQMCTLQWVGVADPDMLRRVYHSAQIPPAGWNRGYFADAQVDALIERAARTPDRAAQKALYSEAQRRIAEAVPAISLWHKTNVIISQPDIRPVVLKPIADLSFLRTTSRCRLHQRLRQQRRDHLRVVGVHPVAALDPVQVDPSVARPAASSRAHASPRSAGTTASP